MGYSIIGLVISWTFALVFIYVSIVACLSLTGHAKFVRPEQQNRLFYVLILQVIGICLAFISGNLKFYETPPPEPYLQEYNNSVSGEILEHLKPLTFSRIQKGDTIELIPNSSNPNAEVVHLLYSDHAQGPVGKPGPQKGHVRLHVKMLVLEKYITPVRNTPWLKVSFQENNMTVTGWYAWENLFTFTLIHKI